MIDTFAYRLINLMKSQRAVYRALQDKFQTENDPWHLGSSLFERERFKKMIKLVKSTPHTKILEVGCAKGHFTKMLLSISDNVTSIDISKEAIKSAKKRAPQAKYIHTSIEDITIKDKFYDVVVCGEVLYYIENRKSSIEKIKRLGKFILISDAGLYPLMVEPYFKDLKLIKRVFHFSLAEMVKFTTISLYATNLTDK